MSHTHPEVEVQVQVRDGMEPGLQRYAREKVAAALLHTARPVRYARIRLDRIVNPAAVRPVVARAEVDVDGRVVHAEASADTGFEAVDLVEDRLRGRIDRTVPEG